MPRTSVTNPVIKIPPFITYSQVKELFENFTGQCFYAHSSIYRLCRQGRFPMPYRKTSQRGIFKSQDVLDWFSSRGFNLPVVVG